MKRSQQPLIARTAPFSARGASKAPNTAPAAPPNAAPDRYTAHVAEWHEQRRHECEVRQLLAWLRQRGRRAVQEYLDAPAVAGRRERLRRSLNAALALERQRHERA